MDSDPWPGIVGAATLGLRPWTSGDWTLLFILVLALIVAAMAAAAETALTSVNRIRLRNLQEEGDKKAKRILRLIDQPQIFLSTILAASNLAIIVASSVATLLAINLFSSAGEVIETIVLAIFVLIFVEITPKTAAVQAPERWARVLVRPVEAVGFVLRPLITALTFITNGIVRLFGGQVSHRGPFLTEEELRLLVDVGQEEVKLEEEKRDMIHNVFELGDTMVREVMVPRIDMVTVEADAPVDEALKLIIQGGQSRIPIYDTTIDNIVGLLYAKDLLRVVATHEQLPDVSSLARPAYFVPETKRLDDLLRELQNQRVHMAIVVDEYGSVAGLVTIEDLVEEIIGDIKDEYDTEEQLFERVGENEYLVDAKVSLDDLNDLLDSKLESEDYDTLGGFVYANLDKIPTIGDTITEDGFRFTVMGTKGRRVTKVRVVRHASGGDEEDKDQRTPPEVPPPQPPLALPAPGDSIPPQPLYIPPAPDPADTSSGEGVPHGDDHPALARTPEDANDQHAAPRVEGGEPAQSEAPAAARDRDALLRAPRLRRISPHRSHGHSAQSRRR
jgi:putative hemolysin